MREDVQAWQWMTHCLRREEGEDTGSPLMMPLEDDEAVWHSAIRQANEHMVAPLLWSRLQARNWTDTLPSAVQQYLRHLHALNGERNACLLQQLEEVVAALNAVGIEPVLLKGAAYLCEGIYTDPAARVMADLDLLLDAPDLSTGWQVLSDLGYGAGDGTASLYMQHHHCPPLHREGELAAIELHRRPLARTAGTVLDSAAVRVQREPYQWRGLRLQRLSPAHTVLHSILHNQWVNRHYHWRWLSLRALYDVLRLDAAYAERIDWPAIHVCMEHRRLSHVLRATLYAIHRLYGMPLPSQIPVNWLDRSHYIRCHNCLRWPWWEASEQLMLRYTRYHIRKRYGYGHDARRRQILMGRLRYTAYLATRLCGYKTGN